MFTIAMYFLQKSKKNKALGTAFKSTDAEGIINMFLL